MRIERRNYSWTGAVVCLLLLLPGVMTARAAKAPETPQKDILRATLPNGLRVIIVRNRLAPVVSTVVNYLAGANETPEGFPGTAHAQEHMMFRGNPGLSADQLAAISASMGGDSNADTMQNVTQYFFNVPAQDMDVALHIEAIRMSGVLDSEKLWDKERGAIEQEVSQDLSDPQYVFYRKLLKAMYHGTPYAHDGLGTRPSFQKTTAAMLKDFYDKWYAPNNAILVIVGDVEPQAALAEVKKLMGAIPQKKLPERLPVDLQPVKAQAMNLPTDYPYGLVYISFRMPGTDSPDYAASVVLADVLSSQRGDLYALVPAGKALETGFETDPRTKSGLGFTYGVFPKGADGAALLQQMRDVLSQDLKKGFSPDLVEAAKRHEVTDAEFQKNSISGLANAWSLAVAIEGRTSPEDDIKAIQRVTPEDVDRVARKYLKEDESITAILTPQASGKPISSKSFGGQESFTPAHVKAVELPDWAKTALGRLEIPESTIHPVVSMLPNGLRLIVQPETISHTISIYGRVRNNAEMETPKGQEGVSSLLGRLLSYGTTTLDRIAFQKALDDIGAEESAGTDFSVRVDARNFDRAAQLLADNELHPALPEHAFKIIQPQFVQAVAGQLQSPDFLTRLSFHEGIYPKGDPMQRHATPETVKSLTLADVHQYLDHVYRPDLTTIVVIGDVKPAEAREVIEKYFGGWKAEGPKPETFLPEVPANGPYTSNVPDRSRVQDFVVLAETLGLNRFDPDYYALELGNHVLGGGFYATRLYRDLRANQGLVYFVNSSFNMGKTRSIYEAVYGCDPDKVTKARAVIIRDLKAMQSEPVTPHELRQAKALLLREIPLGESSLGSIASGLLSRAEIGLPLDEPTVAAHHYVALTAAQVQAAFAKWLRPDGLIQVVEGPAPK